MKSEETIAIEFARHLRHMVIEAGESGPEAYLLRINPKVTAWFIADGARELHALEQETGRYFHFEGSDGLPLDYFAVTMEGTRAEIEEHAVPFRAGEEVHVTLVEPHMYNDDDAVAKVDGYLIDVVNGIAFVGEKKLVRIEEAGRTIARAVLVGVDAEAAEEAASRARRRAREGAAGRAPLAPRPRRARPSAASARTRPRRCADETPAEAGTAPGRGRGGRRRAAQALAPPSPLRGPRDAAVESRAEPAAVRGGAPSAGAEEAPEPARRGRSRKRPAETAAPAVEAEPTPRRGRAEEAPARKGRARKRPAARPSAAEEAVEPRRGRRGGGARAQAPLAPGRSRPRSPSRARGASTRTSRTTTTTRRTATTRYPLALGAAAVEVDGAVRARRLRPTPNIRIRRAAPPPHPDHPTLVATRHVLRSHQDRR